MLSLKPVGLPACPGTSSMKRLGRRPRRRTSAADRRTLSYPTMRRSCWCRPAAACPPSPRPSLGVPDLESKVEARDVRRRHANVLADLSSHTGMNRPRRGRCRRATPRGCRFPHRSSQRSRTTPVSTWVAITATPGITAWLESTTVPRMPAAFGLCPGSGAERKGRQSNDHAILLTITGSFASPSG